MTDKQEIYKELTKHLLEDEKPSGYINTISREIYFLEYPFHMLHKLKSTEQSKIHHPEGSVWNHTMLVVDEAAKVRQQSKDALVFMWSALLHDIGKPDTTKVRKGRITSYDHDVLGAKLSKEFLKCFTDDEKFIQKVAAMVRYHMHMLYILKAMPFGNLKQLLREVDIYEIALLCRCDRFGRGRVDFEAEEKNYQEYLKILKQG